LSVRIGNLSVLHHQSNNEATLTLADYRASANELKRTQDLLDLIPTMGSTALDIGARDGHFSILLAERFSDVIALDLTLPNIIHPKIRCIQGNAANLKFADNSFDIVLCAEVLEHIPPNILENVCSEMERVCRKHLVIGVPYRQDIRVGRTTCYTCMEKNPPWSHVNTFDEKRLNLLFPNCKTSQTSFVGINRDRTNALSAALMDMAGNPYGTYSQEEPCIHCGKPLKPPPDRDIKQKILTRLAFWSRQATSAFEQPTANWIHRLLIKTGAG